MATADEEMDPIQDAAQRLVEMICMTLPVPAAAVVLAGDTVPIAAKGWDLELTVLEAAVPLQARGRRIGGVNVHRDKEDWTGKDERVLSLMIQSAAAEMVAHVEAAELRMDRIEALERSADTLPFVPEVDPQTGLVRRSTFLVEGSRRLASAGPACTFSVAAIELDPQGSIRQAHGLRTYERAQRQFSDLLRRCASAGDLVGRLEGDRFVVLFVDKSEAEARAFAVRLAARSEVETFAEPYALPAVVRAASLEEGAPDELAGTVSEAELALDRALRQRAMPASA